MSRPLSEPARLFGSLARTHAIHQHCPHCDQCYTEAGGWYRCEMAQCDGRVPEAILFWESAKATVARSGRGNPLQICQYVGTC